MYLLSWHHEDVMISFGVSILLGLWAPNLRNVQWDSWNIVALWSIPLQVEILCIRQLYLYFCFTAGIFELI